jgi:hypothetical protein
MNGDYPVVRRPAAIFYHGGVAGLAVGDFILPGGQVDAPEGDLWYWGSDPEFCFVTTDIMQSSASSPLTLCRLGTMRSFVKPSAALAQSIASPR